MGALYCSSEGEAAVLVPRALTSGVRDAEISSRFVAVQVFDVMYVSAYLYCVRDEDSVVAAELVLEGLEAYLLRRLRSAKPFRFFVVGMDANVQLAGQTGVTGDVVWEEAPVGLRLRQARAVMEFA